MEEILKKYFPILHIHPELKEQLLDGCQIASFQKGTVILNEGAYIKVVPLVISGLVKVVQEDENGNEFLLYFIKSGESCMISLSALVKNQKSHVKAIIEEDAEIIILPAELVGKITGKYSQWDQFVYDLFNLRFNELLDVIKMVTFKKTDQRIMNYLTKVSEIKNTNTVKVTHQEIASSLGVSREVVSRLLKQFENEGNVILSHGKIELIAVPD